MEAGRRDRMRGTRRGGEVGDGAREKQRLRRRSGDKEMLEEKGRRSVDRSRWRKMQLWDKAPAKARRGVMRAGDSVL